MRVSRFAIAVVILAAGLAGQWLLGDIYAKAAVRSAAARRQFGEFPRVVGRWRADVKSLTARELELLNVDDYLRADFSSADGGAGISVYAGFYNNPDRATQHPPTICYPGAGWLKTYEGHVSLPIGGAKPILVEETMFESGQRKTLVVYWYRMAGYAGADASWQKAVRLGRLLAGKGVTGAMKIEIALPVDSTRQEAEERLTRFLADFLPALEEFSPMDEEGS
jgi:EpsI family protein